MTKRLLFRNLKVSPEIIRLTLRMYVVFPLSFRKVEDLHHEREIDSSRQTMRFRRRRFGQRFAVEIR